MSGYSFYPSADVAQDAIWKYTAEIWGEDQADKYIRELHDHLARLANSRSTWRKLAFQLEVKKPWDGDVFISRYRQHFVFFRELSNGRIGVIAILHQRMELPAGLSRAIRMVLNNPDEP
jgi:plasmid stabilization system protein ParE